MGGRLALDGRVSWGDTTTNQKSASTVGGSLERIRDRGGTCGGVLSLCSRRRIEQKKIENKRGAAQALGGRQSIKKRNNQPKDSVGGGKVV
jgi:hypothetical protein